MIANEMSTLFPTTRLYLNGTFKLYHPLNWSSASISLFISFYLFYPLCLSSLKLIKNTQVLALWLSWLPTSMKLYKCDWTVFNMTGQLLLLLLQKVQASKLQMAIFTSFAIFGRSISHWFKAFPNLLQTLGFWFLKT